MTNCLYSSSRAHSIRKLTIHSVIDALILWMHIIDHDRWKKINWNCNFQFGCSCAVNASLPHVWHRKTAFELLGEWKRTRRERPYVLLPIYFLLFDEYIYFVNIRGSLYSSVSGVCEECVHVRRQCKLCVNIYLNCAFTTPRRGCDTTMRTLATLRKFDMKHEQTAWSSHGHSEKCETFHFQLMNRWMSRSSLLIGHLCLCVTNRQNNDNNNESKIEQARSLHRRRYRC